MNVIHYDFKNKVKINDYITKKYKCVVCGQVHTYDSRDEGKSSYIELKKDTGICQECAVCIKATVEESGWKIEEPVE